MKQFVAVLLAATTFCVVAFSIQHEYAWGADGGARRALLVGIDRYAHPGTSATGSSIPPSGRRHWTDLKGAVNDVRALREVLIHRLGFEPQNVIVLVNEEATRQAILSAFQRHLIDPAKQGDQSIFFYAGHGSRVRNSRSTELDGKDETVVPADANAGARDRAFVEIRDKEWDRLFSQVLDKGAWLTALFDSCHSGSISRSAAPVSSTARFLEEDDRDVAAFLPPDQVTHAPGLEPEKREGALIISAAQEDQQAKETLQVTGSVREWHGAFSLALIQSLNELPPRVSADRLFDRVTARLMAEGHQQEPSIVGTASRRHAPVFGGTAGRSSTGMRLNLIQAYAADDVELQGGVAIGLTPDTEVERIAKIPGKPPVRLRVTEVRSLTKSRARVLTGNWHDLKPGDEFEVVRRGNQSASALPIWVPPPVGDHRQVRGFARDVASLAVRHGVTMVEDPTVSSPSQILSWNGTEWMLWSHADPPRSLGKSPSAQEVLSHMRSNSSGEALFINVPPTRDVARALDIRGLSSRGVTVVANPDEALYTLVGRMAGSQVAYAWVLTRLSRSTNGRSVRSGLPLPERTMWSGTPPGSGACESGDLRNCLARLAKLHYWLTISGTQGESRYPYRLAFKRVTDHSVIDRGELVEGTYQMVLRADTKQIEAIQEGWGLQARYVYVFVIDREGSTTQLFPTSASLERSNVLPSPEELNRSAGALSEVSLGEAGLISVHPPYGVDTYLLITSARPIPYLAELVESGPVVSPSHPLRGEMDWSIDRLFLRSSPAGAPHGS